MKRLLSIFLAAVMLLGVMPWQVFAEGTEPIDVTFVRKNNSEVKVTFTDETKPLGLNGTPAQTSSWFNKSYFIGWSNNKDYIENGEGFLLYETATVSDLIKETKDKNIKLYPMYASASVADKIGKASLRINDDVKGTEFVNGIEENVNKADDKTTVTIKEADLNDDSVKYEIKALKSEFKTNKFVQAAIYKDPWVGALENGSDWSALSKRAVSTKKTVQLFMVRSR